MSAQHTPGPWQVAHSDRTQVCDVLGCAPIAYIARRNPKGRAEDYANTRLIAAAPDLLEALQAAADALEVLRRGHGVEVSTACYPALNLCRAAITRATGSTS